MSRLVPRLWAGAEHMHTGTHVNVLAPAEAQLPLLLPHRFAPTKSDAHQPVAWQCADRVPRSRPYVIFT